MGRLEPAAQPGEAGRDELAVDLGLCLGLGLGLCLGLAGRGGVLPEEGSEGEGGGEGKDIKFLSGVHQALANIWPTFWP